MTRRDLMKLTASALGAVIFVPFIRQAQVRAAVEVAAKAAPAGPWQMIAWQEQEFTDELGRRAEWWVDLVGFCGIFQNQETRELRRNAVRFEWTRSRSDHRADARRMLRAWGDHLNANWPPDICRRATQRY